MRATRQQLIAMLVCLTCASRAAQRFESGCHIAAQLRSTDAASSSQQRARGDPFRRRRAAAILSVADGRRGPGVASKALREMVIARAARTSTRLLRVSGPHKGAAQIIWTILSELSTPPENLDIRTDPGIPRPMKTSV